MPKELKKKKAVAAGSPDSLDIALQHIQKQYGQGAIMRLGSSALDVSAIPTGVLSVDAALGVGGFPRGRVVEIFGPESSGKTTLALHVVASAQAAGGIAAFVDAEHALDPVYSRALGVNTDDLIITQPDNGEMALEITETLVRSGSVDVIVVDSVAALVPRAELEGEMGDAQVGLQARLMSQALRKLTGFVSKSSTCLVFINQLRLKIGQAYGNPETTTGGRALKFYASVRIDIRKSATIKHGDEAVGSRTKIKVVKNKVAPPFRQTEFDIRYGEGISRVGDLLDIAERERIVEKSGSWYSVDGEQIGQGREKALRRLTEDEALLDQVNTRVREAMGLPPIGGPAAGESGEAGETGEGAESGA